MYKYYSNENYFLDVFINNRIYFNSFRNYNDPSEIFSLVNNTDDGADYVERNLKDQVKCCCFSQKNDNYLLWSHYGKNHRGFCIEFDFSKYYSKSALSNVDKFVYKTNTMFGFYVDYNPKKLCISFSKVKKHLNFSQGIDLVKYKYNFWKYEEEYRLISFIDNQGFIDIPKDSIKSVTYGFNIVNSRRQYLDNRIRKLGYSINTKKLELVPEFGLLI